MKFYHNERYQSTVLIFQVTPEEKMNNFRAYILKVQRYYKGAVEPDITEIFHKILFCVFCFEIGPMVENLRQPQFCTILIKFKVFFRNLAIYYKKHRKTRNYNFVALIFWQNV